MKLSLSSWSANGKCSARSHLLEFRIARYSGMTFTWQKTTERAPALPQERASIMATIWILEGDASLW